MNEDRQRIADSVRQSASSYVADVIDFPVGENAEKGTWIFVDGTPDRVGGEGDVLVFMFATKGWSVYAEK